MDSPNDNTRVQVITSVQRTHPVRTAWKSGRAAVRGSQAAAAAAGVFQFHGRRSWMRSAG